MAMPGGTETYRHYASVSSFRQDEREMRIKGWTTQGFTTHALTNGVLRRVLRRHLREEVDAHYTRLT